MIYKAQSSGPDFHIILHNFGSTRKNAGTSTFLADCYAVGGDSANSTYEQHRGHLRGCHDYGSILARMNSRWLYGFGVLPALCLSLLVMAAYNTKRSTQGMPEWKQGLCGTSIILGFVACLGSLGVVVTGLARSGGGLIIGLAVLCISFSPVAFLLALIIRTKAGKLVMVAQVIQAIWVLMLFGSGGIL